MMSPAHSESYAAPKQIIKRAEALWGRQSEAEVDLAQLALGRTQPRRIASYLIANDQEGRANSAVLLLDVLLRHLGYAVATLQVEYSGAEPSRTPTLRADAARVLSLRPDALCLSAYSYSLDQLLTVARCVAELDPSARPLVIIGGPAVTEFGAEAVAIAEGVDIAVEGEGWYLLPLVLRCLLKADRAWCSGLGTELMEESLVRTLGTRTIRVRLGDAARARLAAKGPDGTVHVSGPPRAVSPTLAGPLQFTFHGAEWPLLVADAIPCGRREMDAVIRFTPESDRWLEPGFGSSLAIYNRPGCPGRCTFCGGRPPFRAGISPEHLCDLVTRAYRHHVVERHRPCLDVSLDSELTLPSEVVALYEGLRRTGVAVDRVRTTFQTRIDAFGDSDVELLGRYPVHVELGLEALAPKAIEMLGKASDGERYAERATAIIRNLLTRGLRVTTFYIAAPTGASIEVVLDNLLALSCLAVDLARDGFRAGEEWNPVVASQVLPQRRSLDVRRSPAGPCDFILATGEPQDAFITRAGVRSWPIFLARDGGRYFYALAADRFEPADDSSENDEDRFKATWLDHGGRYLVGAHVWEGAVVLLAELQRALDAQPSWLEPHRKQGLEADIAHCSCALDRLLGLLRLASCHHVACT